MLVTELNQSQLKNAKLELMEVHKIKPVFPLLPKWGDWELIPTHNKLLLQIDTTPFIDGEYCFQLHILETEYYYTHIYNLGSMSQQLVSEYETLLDGYLLPFIKTTQNLNTFLNNEKSLLELGEKYDFTNKGYIKGELGNMKNLETIIREEIISTLENKEFSDGVYICDLMHELYNMDYYIIGYSESKEFLKDHFDDMLEALESYQRDVGVVYPEIMDTERVATLTAYYVSRSIFDTLTTVGENWDCKLWHDEDILDDILTELRGEN